MRAFAGLTMHDRLRLTAAQAWSRQALWHGLRADRGLAEARLRGRELAHLRGLPGFEGLGEETRALLTAAFVHAHSAGLVQWQQHRQAEHEARRAFEANLEALGLAPRASRPALAGGDAGGPV